jgi:WD40 repeat protein
MAFMAYRSDTRSITILDIKNDYNIIKVIDETQEFINPIAVWPNLMVSNCSLDFIVTVWNMSDTNNMTPIGKLTGHTGWLTNMLYSAKRNLFITESFDYTIRLWNRNDYKCVRTITHDICPALTLLLPNGYFAARSYNNIKIYDINSCESVNILGGYEQLITCMLFIKGNRIVGGCKDKTFIIWDY